MKSGPCITNSSKSLLASFTKAESRLRVGIRMWEALKVKTQKCKLTNEGCHVSLLNCNFSICAVKKQRAVNGFFSKNPPES